MRSKVFK